MMDALLSGIRILDLADETAGFCTKLLADMGAHVIKIEKPGGDPGRSIGPFMKTPSGESISLSFLFNNTHKKGLTLDITHPLGKDIFLDLAAHSHAVVESYPPGFLDQLGLGYPSLSRVNPELILTSITGFGQTGPASRDLSCDLVAAATGGQMHVTGDASGSPLKQAGNQSCQSGSLFAALGVVLALRKVRLVGRGDHIDISLQEAVAATLEHVMVRYFTDHVVPQRNGGRHWNQFTHILPCRDGWMQVTLLEQWDTLVGWLGGDGMAADLAEPQWQDPRFRLDHVDHIITVLSNWTRAHTKAELFETAQLMGFPWAPVESPKAVVDSPQLAARRFFKTVESPETCGVQLTYPGLPFTLTPPQPLPWHGAPKAGEHNVEIYNGLLGMPEKTIKDLTLQGVL